MEWNKMEEKGGPNCLPIILVCFNEGAKLASSEALSGNSPAAAAR